MVEGTTAPLRVVSCRLHTKVSTHLETVYKKNCMLAVETAENYPQWARPWLKRRVSDQSDVLRVTRRQGDDQFMVWAQRCKQVDYSLAACFNLLA